MVFIGLSNYGYSLLLTHLLTVTDYSSFAAGQSLILWATTIATVSVPWVLAQAVVRARSNIERSSALRFAKLTSMTSGIAAAILVGAISSRLASPVTALAIAMSTFVIFLGTTTSGWLQGLERMRSLALLYIAENVLKNGAGVVLVMVFGLKSTGALAAFGIGSTAMLVRWPRAREIGKRSWRELVRKDLLQRAISNAGAQGIVSLYIAVDMVFVALLPGSRALAASYQASATLTRIPVYLAAAIATAFFPSLSRQNASGTIAARAVRMYAAAALPLMFVLATIPATLLTRVFPTQYGAVEAMLKYTAVTGLAAGGISLVTTFFQAVDDYSCLKWLGAGVALYVGGLLTGWRVDGVVGLAAGGAIGSAIALLLIGYRLVRIRGRVVLAWIPIVEPLVSAAALIASRRYPLIWLAVALVVGALAGLHFFRPGSRQPRLPRWATPRSMAGEPLSPNSILINAIWWENNPEVTEAELRSALALALLNRVEGRLARAYPLELADLLSEVNNATESYVRIIHHAAHHLRHARIPALLIEDGRISDSASGGVNLVVPRRYWRGALSALSMGDARRIALHPDQHERALIELSEGHRLELHTDLSWLGTQFLPTNQLMARARRGKEGLLEPSRVDYLRIILGRALIHHRQLYLSQLLILWDLMSPAVVMAARIEAGREGWLRSFDDMLALAENAINMLDQGQSIPLPVTPSALQSLMVRQKTQQQVRYAS